MPDRPRVEGSEGFLFPLSEKWVTKNNRQKAEEGRDEEKRKLCPFVQQGSGFPFSRGFLLRFEQRVSKLDQLLKLQ